MPSAEDLPVPEQWTLNFGASRRRLKPGMVIRFDTGDMFKVERANETGAVITGIPDSGRRLQISLYSVVCYKKELDDYDRRVIESSRHVTRKGDQEMAKNQKPMSKVAGAPMPEDDEPKGAKGPKEKKERKPKEPVVLKPCLCGCGLQVARYFAPGHDARYKGWLTKIKKGAKPKDLLTPELVKGLGPWVDSTEGGQIPSKHYSDLPR